MPAEGWQLNKEDGSDSYNFDGKSSTLKYLVRDTDDLAEANAWVIANTGATYFGMTRKNINHELIGPSIWMFDVVYDGKFQKAENASGNDQTNTALDFQFETTLEQFQADTALDETVYLNGAGPAPEFNKVIGLSSLPDQPPQGIQLGAGISRWTETYKWPVAQVTGAYELTVDNMTGKINNAAFRGRPEGCVLFLGCRSRASSTDFIEVAYNFEYRAPKSNYDVGDIRVASKEGYQLQEVVYFVEKDVANKVLKRNPLYVRILDVLEKTSFATLNIGTGARP